MPLLEKLKTHFADKPFRIVMVDVGEPPETVRRFLSRYNYTFPVLLDSRGAVSEKYHVLGHPIKFLVDKNGNLAFSTLGYHDWDSKEWAASLERFLREPGAGDSK